MIDPSLAPIDKMFFALGGRDAILALDTLRVAADGTRFIAGEGVTPEDDPAAANTYASTTSLDLANGNARVDTTRQIRFLFGGEQTYAEIFKDGLGAIDGVEHAFGFPGGAMSADRAAAFDKQVTLLNPLRIARAIAEDDTIVSDGGEAILGRLLFHVLVVEDEVAPIELYVDAQTGELARVSTIENDYLHRDVPLEAIYLDWVPSGGVSAPREVYLVKGDDIVAAETREPIEVNPALDATLFDFADGVTPVANEALRLRGKQSSQFHYGLQSFGLPEDGVEGPFTVVDAAPGVLHLLGITHNAFVVEQQDGLVVVDAPLYEERADAILDVLEARFPGKPVTRVVASHFHEDHVSGIRALLGANPSASLVVSESTEALWRKILGASSRIKPDALADNPRTVDIITVPRSGSLTLADPAQPVTLYNLASSHAADLLFAHADAADVGFVVDVYSPGLGAFPVVAEEFRDGLVDRGLDSATLKIAGGHGGLIQSFADLEGAIDAL